MTDGLSPNTLAFMALSGEYCREMEKADEAEPAAFVAAMTRLLPRLYISGSDLQGTPLLEETAYLVNNALSEDYYDSVRRYVENLLGADDSFLEVFEEDMKYSDTPIGASISEMLADIYQSLYNFLDTVKDAPNELIDSVVEAVKEDFESYLSRKICNVMRPLNALRYNPDFGSDY